MKVEERPVLVVVEMEATRYYISVVRYCTSGICRFNGGFPHEIILTNTALLAQQLLLEKRHEK
jgi:hypothetical protein